MSSGKRANVRVPALTRRATKRIDYVLRFSTHYTRLATCQLELNPTVSHSHVNVIHTVLPGQSCSGSRPLPADCDAFDRQAEKSVATNRSLFSFSFSFSRSSDNENDYGKAKAPDLGSFGFRSLSVKDLG